MEPPTTSKPTAINARKKPKSVDKPGRGSWSPGRFLVVMPASTYATESSVVARKIKERTVKTAIAMVEPGSVETMRQRRWITTFPNDVADWDNTVHF